MADEGNVLTNLDNGSAANGADNSPIAGLLSQYVKDLSVENPKAPESFQWQEQPELDVQFNIGARTINEEVHEIELRISATATTSLGTVYVVELAYCGLIGLRNLPDDQAHAFLFAEGPRILFPFARRVVADATRDAGFAPLLLDPIDFQGLYLQNLQRQQEEGGEAPVTQ
ncbi:MAG: protein-export chaperone SecB [Candidatus Andeanibacterium colombiense]|uniref:Protein-export protein SecB n=1 Tax=Candidatus Andeanibacterium colombiense TaxID=3121345 RepID=A0AAJ5X5M9_9SPHN|nr:MAG: protein-export chaperone SecB [Sphingomonadaceae bacterium]